MHPRFWESQLPEQLNPLPRAWAESISTDMLEAEFITLRRLRTLGKTPHG